MVPEIWEEHYRILSYQAEPNGRASLPGLYGFLLESAANHATAGGFGFKDMLSRGLIWVLTRFKLVIDRYPLWNEKIIVRTWGKGRDGIFYTRDYDLQDEAAGLLGRATSSWAVLSVESRKPEAGDIYVRHFPHNPSHHALAEQLQKLPALESAERVAEYRVRFSDLDFNRHANAVRYVEWMMNGLDEQTRLTRTFKSVEVNYLEETRLGDEIIVKVRKAQDAPNSLLASVTAKETVKEAARARFEIG